MKYQETDLEKMVRKELERREINFVTQHPFRFGFIADFALLDKKIIIEADGHPSHFTNDGKRKKYFRDKMFKRAGWKIFHFTGEEIEKDVSVCIDRIFK